MSNIPADAAHWDSGDWIDWHRQAAPPQHTSAPCAAPSDDPQARLHSLHLRMIQCARAYHELTGLHLPIYEGIARIHAAIAFDLPASDPVQGEYDLDAAQIITLAPGGPHDIITVDLSQPFCCLIVVRINEDFSSEARMMPRKRLPDQADRSIDLRWRDMPTAR
ncbi:hypothetical protein So717_03300 [Roseobacter cerasinus]|uniref:Uncharacterized protein n=1 Tax=Roseobacter cerasinus TaxID=2602289 RepID=A0A640VLE4_9RHOB|nr:hypothetical protein [Roseobacter cerasinus]GFE48577.1 hypothetical protein So717_03300 [Roseobacter cerasinus]